MRKEMKKLISMALLTVLLVASLSGCGSPAASEPPEASGLEESATATASASASDSASPSDDAPEQMSGALSAEPVTLNVLTTRWGTMGDSFTKNQWIIDLEARTNVKVDWQVQSLNDWNEQKAILLASSDLPEVAMGGQTFSDADISGNADLFLELSDLIEKNMPNLLHAMSVIPAMKTIITNPEGEIYSLPKNLPCRPVTCGQPIINKTWLDHLGLAVPTTTDDLYAVLKAFKEQDANGNGDKNDEIGYAGSRDVTGDLLNPFGITDLYGSHMLVNRDGSLSYYPISDQYKEAIKWLEKLYAEGLIDPETFTQDGTMLDGKRKNESVALVGFDYAWTPDSLFGQWSSQYIAIAPIKGPDGMAYAGGDKDGVSSIVRNEAEITTACKDPDLAAKWLDQFYDGEASIQNFWGAIDTVISKNGDGSYTLNNPPEGTSADAWYWDQSLRDFGPKFISPDFQKLIKLSPESGDGLKQELSKMGEPFVTTPYPNVMYTTAENEQRASLLADIDSYVGTTRAMWITKGGIEEEWDAYVKQLENMGSKDLIKIYTDAYARYTAAQ